MPAGGRGGKAAPWRLAWSRWNAQPIHPHRFRDCKEPPPRHGEMASASDARATRREERSPLAREPAFSLARSQVRGLALGRAVGRTAGCGAAAACRGPNTTIRRRFYEARRRLARARKQSTEILWSSGSSLTFLSAGRQGERNAVS